MLLTRPRAPHTFVLAFAGTVIISLLGTQVDVAYCHHTQATIYVEFTWKATDMSTCGSQVRVLEVIVHKAMKLWPAFEMGRKLTCAKVACIKPKSQLHSQCSNVIHWSSQIIAEMVSAYKYLPTTVLECQNIVRHPVTNKCMKKQASICQESQAGVAGIRNQKHKRNELPSHAVVCHMPQKHCSVHGTTSH